MAGCGGSARHGGARLRLPCAPPLPRRWTAAKEAQPAGRPPDQLKVSRSSSAVGVLRQRLRRHYRPRPRPRRLARSRHRQSGSRQHRRQRLRRAGRLGRLLASTKSRRPARIQRPKPQRVKLRNHQPALQLPPEALRTHPPRRRGARRGGSRRSRRANPAQQEQRPRGAGPEPVPPRRRIPGLREEAIQAMAVSLDPPPPMPLGRLGKPRPLPPPRPHPRRRSARPRAQRVAKPAAAEKAEGARRVPGSASGPGIH
jgi:hypothetical protein